MIKSMTGFGKSSLEENQREYQMEIKSVNHRYLDINVRGPKCLSYLEEKIKKEVGKRIKRGKVEVYLSFQNNSEEGKNIKINKDLANMYIQQLKELADGQGLQSDISVIDIAKLPDVLKISNDHEDETIEKEVIKITKEASSKLKEMRIVEGSKMAEDMGMRIQKIEEKITEISSISTGLIEEYVVKLEGRIKEILKTEEIDKSRIAQEVVIYADKCSIEEEITRLKSHIVQFKSMLQTEEPVGKKLDFIIQEMNRETNTIGSKANKLEITNGVIDIKTELENIREQIQNIE